MSIEQIIILIVLIAFVALPFILRRVTRLNPSSGDSFATGNRNYNWFYLTAGLSATFIGGAAVLNLGALGYQFSWFALADVIPTSLALVITSIFLVSRIKKNNIETLGQLIGEDSKIRMVSGLLSTFVYILITAAQIIALTTILNSYFDLSIELLSLLAVFFIGAYVSFGGYKSVTVTDVLQFLMMILFYILIASPVLIFEKGSTSQSLNLFQQMPTDVILLLALTFLFVPSSQDVHVRIQSSKSVKDAKLGLILAACFYLIVGFTSIVIGIYAKKEGIELENPDNVVPHYLSLKLGEFSILPMIAIIAIIVSTLDSMVFNVVTSFNYDFIGSLKKDKVNFNKESRLTTYIVLAIALVIALYYPSILSLILTSLVLYVSILFPILIARSINIITKKSFLISISFLVIILVLEIYQVNLSYRYIIYSIAHFTSLYILFLLSKNR